MQLRGFLISVAACVFCFQNGQGAAAQTFVEPDVRVVHTFTGEAGNDVFGWVTGRLGDLDDDGVDDLIITAPFNDAAGNNAGRVYIYSSVTGQEIHRFTGPLANGIFGNSVADIGRIDDDEYIDIMIGAPGAGPGRAFVHSGRTGQRIRSLAGEANGDRFGDAVRPIGLLDDDQVNEIIVGAPRHDGAGADAGRVYIYSGANWRLLHTIDGPGPGANFGSVVAGLGDLDDDGVPDFGVGAPGAGPNRRGRAFIYSGADFSQLCELIPRTSGRAFTDLFMSSPGDISGDHKPDIYATDWNDVAGGSATGRAYLYQFENGSCRELYVLTGARSGEGFGIGNGTAGDVNRDGVMDLLIGSWLSSDGASAAGKVEAFNGPDGARIRTMTSAVANEALGFDAHTMGDVTGDSFPDFLLSAAYNNTRGFRAGRVYLVAGNNPCPGDFTKDCAVDHEDYVAFADCMTGPDNGPIPADCWTADLDFDDDVDLRDHALFQGFFGG